MENIPSDSQGGDERTPVSIHRRGGALGPPGGGNPYTGGEDLAEFRRQQHAARAAARAEMERMRVEQRSAMIVDLEPPAERDE